MCKESNLALPSSCNIHSQNVASAWMSKVHRLGRQLKLPLKNEDLNLTQRSSDWVGQTGNKRSPPQEEVARLENSLFNPNNSNEMNVSSFNKEIVISATEKQFKEWVLGKEKVLQGKDTSSMARSSKLLSQLWDNEMVQQHKQDRESQQCCPQSNGYLSQPVHHEHVSGNLDLDSQTWGNK